MARLCQPFCHSPAFRRTRDPPLRLSWAFLEYVASHIAALAPEWTQKRTVVAHLGNGASLCALRGGESLDTTMGLTPLDGLVMGTRCGAIDPGVLLYLLQEEKMSADELQRLLYGKSGLLGVSGLSADMRTLLASGEVLAREAVDLFAFRVAGEVAVMANTLAGLDGLVFTGGIGEHSAEIRRQICDRLAWLGVNSMPRPTQRGNLTLQRKTVRSMYWSSPPARRRPSHGIAPCCSMLGCRYSPAPDARVAWSASRHIH